MISRLGVLKYHTSPMIVESVEVNSLSETCTFPVFPKWETHIGLLLSEEQSKFTWPWWQAVCYPFPSRDKNRTSYLCNRAKLVQIRKEGACTLEYLTKSFNNRASVIFGQMSTILHFHPFLFSLRRLIIDGFNIFGQMSTNPCLTYFFCFSSDGW